MDFEALYTQHFSSVYRFLLKLTRSPDLAEELTAETFFKAMKSVDRFRGDCSLSVWLCQIAKNCYYDHWNRAKRHTGEEPSEVLPDPAPTMEEQLLDQDTAAQLRRQLHGLPDPYREVVMWRVLGELPFDEIGTMFGKTANWACVTYHRGKKLLTERMNKDGSTL